MCEIIFDTSDEVTLNTAKDQNYIKLFDCKSTLEENDDYINEVSQVCLKARHFL